MKIDTLTIVGVGLIGGSIGLALRRRDLATRIIGVGRQKESLDAALKVGAIDKAVLDLNDGVRDADVVVFCTPVHLIVQQVLAAAETAREGALFTDAGSTKTTIVHGIDEQLSPRVHFVGSHPLAGSEKKGPGHADADLFVDRVTVVTPTEKTDKTALGHARDFWQALGSRVREMTPEDHDHALALTSHLPHLIAAALAGILPPEMHELTATGFRDTTRIAAGDPTLWTGIFQHNRDEVLRAMTMFTDQLADFRKALEKDDDIVVEVMLTEGKKVRDALGN